MAKSAAAAVKSTPAPAAPAASHLSFVDVDESKLHLSETYTISDYKKDLAKAADKLSSACRVAFATLGEEKEAVAAYVADKWGESLELKNYTKGAKLGEIQKANPSYYQAINGAYKTVFGGEAAPKAKKSAKQQKQSSQLPAQVLNFEAVEGLIATAGGGDIGAAIKTLEALKGFGDIGAALVQLEKAQALGDLTEAKAWAIKFGLLKEKTSDTEEKK